jgi:formylglycine-generating enzyme required for sulfatase activity
MHGNVWELCRDLYAEQLPGGRDPDVKSNHEGKASYQLIRGGSWGWVAAICRSGNRSRPLPGNRIDSYGLRVALSSVR